MVRVAQRSDADALSAMLARAFEDDPVTVWAHPDGRKRPRRVGRFFAGRLRTLLAHELCWTTGELEGAALWAPPDAWAAPPGELLRGIRALTPHRALITVYGLGDIERVHPRQTHFYLSVLGVEPGRQGQGVGSRLIGPGLEMCDREGVPAYLETAKARNVTFYERHGFRVTDERRLPRGPKVWLMWREPR